MTKKPDIDNLVKLVFDAMNRIVWMDDKQVSSLITKKVYSEKSKVSVKVYELSE
jgi:Holliday junction resolvase RusA-like endonuclease